MVFILGILWIWFGFYMIGQFGTNEGKNPKGNRSDYIFGTIWVLIYMVALPIYFLNK